MLVVVVAVGFATQALFKSTIEDSLNKVLDKAQAYAETGDFASAVLYAGSDLLQVIDENGTVLASSANAEGLAPIVEPKADAGTSGKEELRAPELHQQDGAQGGSGSGSSGNSGGSQAPAPQAGSGAEGGSAKGSSSAGKSSSTKEPEGEEPSSGKEAQAGKEAQGGKEAQSGKEQQSSKGSAANSGAQEPDGKAGAQSAPAQPNENGGKASQADGGQRAQGQKGAPQGANAFSAQGEGASGTRDAQQGGQQPEAGQAPRAAGALDLPFRIVFAYADDAASASADADEGSYVDASSVLGDEGPYLVMNRSVESPSGTVTLAAMASMAPAIRSAQTTAQVLALVLAVVLVAVAFFAWYLAGRTLEPVRRMSEQAARMSASDLSGRVEVPQGDADLAQLGSTFNDLLARIEQSVEEQKRFMSDASHELKSPVAATRIMLETLRDHPEALEGKDVVDDLRSENERMAQIVGDMLILARQDENRMNVEKAPVDLFDLLHEEASTLRIRCAAEVDTCAVQPVIVRADAELLSHAVRNLLDNAARYAKSTVKISCSDEDGSVSIKVSDDGPGIAPEDRERVFDRFVRLEDSRSRKQGSTGLGLAVVKGIVERHGGTVRFDEPEIGGATAIIELAAD